MKKIFFPAFLVTFFFYSRKTLANHINYLTHLVMNLLTQFVFYGVNVSGVPDYSESMKTR